MESSIVSASVPSIFASTDDFQALSALSKTLQGAAAPGPSLLTAEVSRLSVVDPEGRAPFVRLGSRVTYCDRQRRVRTARIVMPGTSSIHEHCVSITTPIGAALLGLTVGDVFSWWTTGGSRSVEVLDIGK